MSDLEGCILDEDGNAVDSITYSVIPPERLIKVPSGQTFNCFDVDTLYRNFYASGSETFLNPYNRQPFSNEVVDKIIKYGTKIGYQYVLYVDRPYSHIMGMNSRIRIHGQIPCFVRLGDLIIKLVVDGSKITGFNEYTSLLKMDININGLPTIMDILGDRIKLTNEISTILTRDNNTNLINTIIFKPFEYIDGKIKQQLWLKKLQQYTREQASGQMDNNYYIYQSVTHLLHHDDNLTLSTLERIRMSLRNAQSRPVEAIIQGFPEEYPDESSTTSNSSSFSEEYRVSTRPERRVVSIRSIDLSSNEEDIPASSLADNSDENEDSSLLRLERMRISFRNAQAGIEAAANELSDENEDSSLLRLERMRISFRNAQAGIEAAANKLSDESSGES
jgi:hypothetical protein